LNNVFFIILDRFSGQESMKMAATKFSSGLLASVRQVLEDQRGSFLPTAAIMLGAVVVAMGTALDVSQRAASKSALIAAVDSAALAAAKSYDGEDRNLDSAQLVSARAAAKTEVERLANMYAKANLNFGKLNMDGATFELTAEPPKQEYTNDARVLTVKVKGKVKFMSSTSALLGMASSSMEVESTATKSFPLNREIAMALDVTGSMGGNIPGESKTKLQGLREAVMAMYDHMVGIDPTRTYTTTELNNFTLPSDVKIGIVPYSENVNLTAWSPTGSRVNMIEADQFDVPAGLETWVSNPGTSGNWTGCIRERDTDRSISGFNATNVTAPATAYDILDVPAGGAVPKWMPLFARPVARRTLQWNGSWSNDSSWNWYNMTGVTPVYAQRDSNSGQYYPTTPYSYLTSASGGSTNASVICPSPSLPMDSGIKRNDMQTYLNQLQANGNTMSNLGFAWANRMISPQKPLTGGVAYGQRGTQKILVLMTDGYIVSGSYSVSEIDAYGNAYERRVRDTSDVSNEVRLAFEQRLAMVCQSAKWPQGYVGTSPAVRLFVVLFGLTQSQVEAKRSLYERCATPGDFIAARSNKELADAFKKIGGSDLRISE
jgi:Flp pilus assembly protein TadG